MKTYELPESLGGVMPEIEIEAFWECERCREGEHGNVAEGRCLCCSAVIEGAR